MGLRDIYDCFREYSIRDNGSSFRAIAYYSGKEEKRDSSKSENKADNKSDYIDVVYLKNGGVIKGMIIEQTPNVQIKIQTKDGSIFVYKFDEIEKITKEQSK